MLYRTTGSQPVFAIRREIDRLFEDAFGGSTIGRGAWIPAVDVREDPDSYRFDLELPGVDPDTVEVTADQGVLTVRGEKHQRSEHDENEARMHVMERTYGSFSRAFQLPQGVDDAAISAEFDRGLLTVRVPKRSRPEPRRIQINSPVAERPALGEREANPPSKERQSGDDRSSQRTVEGSSRAGSAQRATSGAGR